jgi:hypothetical protein
MMLPSLSCWGYVAGDWRPSCRLLSFSALVLEPLLMTLGPVAGDEQPALTRKAQVEAMAYRSIRLSASSICWKNYPAEVLLYRNDGVEVDENPFPHFIAPEA